MMRLISVIFVLTILMACNATTQESSKKSITAQLTSELRSSKFYHRPLEMAQRVTNDETLRKSLKLGDFKQYDQATLEVLNNLKDNFDEPGKSIIYQSTYLELEILSSEPPKLTAGIKLLKKVKLFFSELKSRIIALSRDEISNTASCFTEHAWKNFPSNQKEIFNKMALGIDLNSFDTLNLTYNPPDKISDEMTPKNVDCLLVSLGLDDEYQQLYN